MLVTLTWAGLMFLAGMSWIWITGIAGVGAAGIVALYGMVPHVQSRIDRFLDPEAGDSYQVTIASTPSSTAAGGDRAGRGDLQADPAGTATPTSSSPSSARSSDW